MLGGETASFRQFRRSAKGEPTHRSGARRPTSPRMFSPSSSLIMEHKGWSSALWNGVRPALRGASKHKIEREGNTLMMKIIASGLVVLGLLTIQVSEADAAACAAGPYRAGCVGPRGAVGVHRGYGYGYGYHGGAAVVRPASGARCYWRAGVRICR
jgi:hypothetical protein